MRHYVLPEILRGEVTGAEAEFYAEGKRSAGPHPIGGYDTVRTGASGAILFTREGGLSRNDGPALVAHDGKKSFFSDSHPMTLLEHLRKRGVHVPESYTNDDFEEADYAVREGTADYHLLVSALRDGAPVDWALSFASGKVAEA